MSTEKIKTKIKAMLNLAANDAAADGEIANALAMAQRLMDDHNLSEDDLTEDGECEVSADSFTYARKFALCGGARNSEWETSLGCFVCRFIGGVQCYFPWEKKAGKKTVAFYGTAEDVELACELFGEIRLAIVAMAKMSYGGVFRGPGRSYCEGFVDGLFLKMNAARRSERKRLKATSNGRSLMVVDQRNALIKAKKEKGKEHLKSIGVRLGGSLKIGGGGHWDSAHASGKADGSNYAVEKSRRLKIGSE